MIAVLVEARLVFRVPLRGSLLLLLLEGALFILVSLVARHSDLGAHLVAARGDDGRAARDDAAERPAVGLHLSGREHAARCCGSCRTSCPGRWFVAIARGIMLKGVGLDYVWRETLILAAMAAVLLAASVALVQRAAGVAMRRILFLAQAEVLHIVRDRVLLAQIAGRADRPAADPVERRDVRDSQHADPRSSISIARAASRGLVNHLAASGTSTSSARRRRSIAADERAAATAR